MAIALYFAILKVHPTPFCIMDEIEAALDEANVVRTAGYMRTLADKTQFIVITHRRGTMEAADVLYGVTMQEQGISVSCIWTLNQMERDSEFRRRSSKWFLKKSKRTEKKTRAAMGQHTPAASSPRSAAQTKNFTRSLRRA